MTRAFALELAYGRAVAVAIDDADAGPPEPPEELALARQFGPARARGQGFQDFGSLDVVHDR